MNVSLHSRIASKAGRALSAFALGALAVLAGAWLSPPAAGHAHCDTLDGPVVTAARRALASGDLRPVLAWIRPADEREIRDAFREALRLHRDRAARGVADRWFFETVVRVHRAGEGEAFTGLRPAGADLGVAIPAADRALESGSSDEVERLLVDEVRHGLHERFAAVTARRAYAPTDLAAARAHVSAYVAWTHYVEGIHEAANAASDAGHHSEAAAPGGHDDTAEPAAGHHRHQ